MADLQVRLRELRCSLAQDHVRLRELAQASERPDLHSAIFDRLGWFEGVLGHPAVLHR